MNALDRFLFQLNPFSWVVECKLRVLEVAGLIPSRSYQRRTKMVTTNTLVWRPATKGQCRSQVSYKRWREIPPEIRCRWE